MLLIAEAFNIHTPISDQATRRRLEFPFIRGNKDHVLKNIHFTDCSFVKVAESVLPDYKKHGPAAWGRKIDAPIVKLAENVVFNNTTFTAD